MNVEISQQELGYVTQLVDSRVSELHPEIRHSMNHEFKDQLRQELECLQGLLSRLKSLGRE